MELVLNESNHIGAHTRITNALWDCDMCPSEQCYCLINCVVSPRLAYILNRGSDPFSGWVPLVVSSTSTAVFFVFSCTLSEWWLLATSTYAKMTRPARVLRSCLVLGWPIGHLPWDSRVTTMHVCMTWNRCCGMVSCTGCTFSSAPSTYGRYVGRSVVWNLGLWQVSRGQGVQVLQARR